MKANPSVCCVMLANGREAMVRRATESFRLQLYPYKSLLIYDNSSEYGAASRCLDNGRNVHVISNDTPGRTIGTLRNAGNEMAKRGICDIIIHWDSDDWSHPNRIAEQVALLEASGKECVGYRDMLFWKQRPFESQVTRHPDTCTCGTCGPGHREVVSGIHDLGSAWLYTNQDPRYCLGTSLCYWRSVWEKHPFPDLPRPGATDNAHEDNVWLRGVQSVGVGQGDPSGTFVPGDPMFEPRMICSIHGNNSSDYGMHILGASPQWKRVPEWDKHCREVMAL